MIYCTMCEPGEEEQPAGNLASQIEDSGYSSGEPVPPPPPLSPPSQSPYSPVSSSATREELDALYNAMLGALMSANPPGGNVHPSPYWQPLDTPWPGFASAPAHTPARPRTMSLPWISISPPPPPPSPASSPSLSLAEATGEADLLGRSDMAELEALKGALLMQTSGSSPPGRNGPSSMPSQAPEGDRNGSLSSPPSSPPLTE